MLVMWRVQSTLRWLVVVVAVCSLQCGRVLAQTEIGTSGGNSSCYCNSGDDCSANTCSRNFGCEVLLDIKSDQPAILIQYCVQIFLTAACIVSDTVLCCDNDMCNMCPNLYDFSIIQSEELYDNLTAQLPTECNYPPFTSRQDSPLTGSTTGFSTVVLSQPPPLWLVPIVVLSVIFIFMVILTALVCCYVMKKRCKNVDVESIEAPIYDSSGLGLSQSDESGALVTGRRLLQTKTISGMIHLQERIAKGGYGEVWKAEWEENEYAVKVFRSVAHEFWKREGEIYKTCMLTHKNILNFISMDTKITNYGVDYWLIFDFHEHGSLSKYLTNHTVSRSHCLSFLISIAAGLSYLHRSILTSTQDRKPIIAHRDLKSSNILIKKDMTCCIGDLGLSVTESDFSNAKELPNPRLGTMRYLAPEILGGTIRGKNIQSYVMADVYSFSLIIWEVSRRNQWDGDVLPYEVPYHNVVPSDPSLENMKLKIVEEKIRPPLDPNWKNDEILTVISRILHECWRADPNGRLSSLRIMKNLQALSVEAKQNYTSNEE